MFNNNLKKSILLWDGLNYLILMAASVLTYGSPIWSVHYISDMVSGDNSCEPELADDCFGGIQQDLKYILDLKKSVAFNLSYPAIHDLCLAVNDSVLCISDDIQEDCTEQEQSLKIEIWLSALWATYHYLCEGTHERLKGILEGISCWNIEDFLMCTLEKAGIGGVEDILKLSMEDLRCEKLQAVMSQCYRDSMADSCREQENISVLVSGMIKAFFSDYDCSEVVSTLHSSSLHISLNLSLMLICLVAFLRFW